MGVDKRGRIKGVRKKCRRSQQLRIYLFIFGFISGLTGADSEACYMLNEPGLDGVMRWVLPYEDPCSCRGKALLLGGLNTRHQVRPFTPVTFDLSAVNPTDLKAVLQSLNCPDDKRAECTVFNNVTSAGYRYEFERLPKSESGEVLLHFSVRAKSDAHIGLVSQNHDVLDMYEIVIGGWSNTKSVIRKIKQGPNMREASDSAGFLDEMEYKRFWVRAVPGNSKVTISVGRGNEENAFLTFEDVSPLVIDYVAFNQYASYVASYKFCGLQLKE